jgi:hypothetical protein
MSSPSISPSSSSTTDSITPTPTSSSGPGGGAPATATLLFGFLVIFAALFAAFLLLAFFWKIQQRRQTAFLPEFDDIRGSNRGVPKLWEVWIRDEASEKEWNWENATTVSFCVVQYNSPRPSLQRSHDAVSFPLPYPCLVVSPIPLYDSQLM